jgi:hypothetical protein
MNPNSNGYVFLNENKIYDYLYLKLSPEKLQKALPISYENDINKSYLTAIFANGRDYLGQLSFEEIKEAVQKNNMVSILDNDYEYVKTCVPNLSLEDYEGKKTFFTNQLIN